MKYRFKVTFTTYEEYEVDAEDENEAEAIAGRLLAVDRSRSIANLHTDEVDVECLDDEYYEQ